ncbi:MAG: alpha/beta fold hydrolase [Pseudomonadota bacterium]|nr:alpha/beta fold hydrolase [Pseudomonadota bacterium]
MKPPPSPPLPLLPMHLALSLGCWLSSPFAWASAKNGWPASSSNYSPESHAALRQALAGEAKSRAHDLLSGILRYYETPYKRDLKEPPCIWQRGNARLLDYEVTAAAHQPVTLFIPSLINRYYILDLDKERSLLRFMARHGIYPLVLDWGAPGEYEKDFGCDDYVTEILLPAIDFLARSAGRITLAGYCMGGNLALAATQLRQKQVAALALLATPWDFHCREFSSFILDKSWLPMVESLIASEKHIPADVLQSLFYMADPWVFEKKFRRFAQLKPESREAQEFVALERWVNDGVPMTAQAARDCLIGWAQNNELAGGKWQVAGKKIDPAVLKMPTFIAIPQNDRIVPQGCAAALAKATPKAHVIHPGGGHVGMIVGGQAKQELWLPLVTWMKTGTFK